jgi:hypothetical protein
LGTGSFSHRRLPCRLSISRRSYSWRGMGRGFDSLHPLQPNKHTQHQPLTECAKSSSTAVSNKVSNAFCSQFIWHPVFAASLKAEIWA